MISFRPLMNSDRFLQRDSIAYARATFAGSRVFQASSASRAFCIALSRVNGGSGGRAGVVGVAMISSPKLIPSAFPWTHVLGRRDLVGGRVCGHNIRISRLRV